VTSLGWLSGPRELELVRGRLIGPVAIVHAAAESEDFMLQAGSKIDRILGTAK